MGLALRLAGATARSRGLKMKVLVIDDNQRVVDDITFCLQVRYPDANVVSASEGERGIDLVETESPDLLIVDSSLPDISTLELVGRVRAFSDVALIVIAEENNVFERAKELEMGADEYINKSFSPIEFLAKVRALLRRIEGTGFKPQNLVNFGDLAVNFATREVFLSGKRLKLTPIEYQLLSELVRNEGRVITHGTLLEKIWGSEYFDDPGAVKKYVHRLRSKIEPDINNPQMIITERGVGYRFTKVV